MATLTPKLTATPTVPPTYNVGMAETFSWVPIEGAGRPLFARAGYITNFDDFAVSISAAELNISSIEIKDGNSNRVADVEDVGGVNALRVATQNLKSTTDNIAIGDLSGNLVGINQSLSALRIFEVAPVTAVNIINTVAISGSITVTNPITAVNISNTTAVSGSVTVLNAISSVSITNPVTQLSATILNPSFTVLNPVTAVSITNQLTGITVTNLISSVTLTNPTTAVNINNTVAVSGSITLTNPVSSVSLTNQLTGITILNPITAVSLINQLSSFSVTNPTTAVSINNTVAISGSVTVLNPVSSVSLVNQISSISITNTVAVSGGITVLNPISSVSITNPTSAVYILNTAAVSGSITVTNPTTGVNVLNSIALKDLNNNNVTVVSATSSLNVNVTNPIVATVDPSVGFPISFAHTPNFDAFGRLRISSPLTLFDSSHRYNDNNLWSSLTAVGGSTSFNQNQGLIDMTVSNLSGSSVIRETTKVFSYQAGKSLQVMNTFVMAPSATNLRQRVGYFGQDNGIYVQLDDSTISFVERSLVNGSPSSETIVPLSAWNGDKLDGNGPSGLTLDITKAQIFWMDIEWLGVGTVRCGLVINGQFVVCHSFHHANLIASTYITTASLPLRYEITNKGATSGSRTLKQVCSTVISEGGYELRGLQQAVGTSILSPKALATAGTLYPVATIRLKSSPNRLDAIVILTAISLMGTGTGIYNWQVIASGTTSGGSGTWVSAGDNSSVQYKLDATSISGGRILASGFFTSNTQGATTIDILKEALFKFQLERNSLTSTPYELILAVTASTNTELVYGSLDWEEVSR